MISFITAGYDPSGIFALVPELIKIHQANGVVPRHGQYLYIITLSAYPLYMYVYTVCHIYYVNNPWSVGRGIPLVLNVYTQVWSLDYSSPDC